MDYEKRKALHENRNEMHWKRIVAIQKVMKRSRESVFLFDILMAFTLGVMLALSLGAITSKRVAIGLVILSGVVAVWNIVALLRAEKKIASIKKQFPTPEE